MRLNSRHTVWPSSAARDRVVLVRRQQAYGAKREQPDGAAVRGLLQAAWRQGPVQSLRCPGALAMSSVVSPDPLLHRPSSEQCCDATCAVIFSAHLQDGTACYCGRGALVQKDLLVEESASQQAPGIPAACAICPDLPGQHCGNLQQHNMAVRVTRNVSVCVRTPHTIQTLHRPVPSVIDAWS